MTTTVITSADDDPTGDAANEGFGTAETSAQGDAQSMLMTDVRLGVHDGFDRVVIDLDSGQADNLTWLADYRTDPHTQARGDAIELPGDTTLCLTIRGLRWPEANDPVVSGDQGQSGDVVEGVFVDPVFEGQSLVYLGIPADASYRVFTLDAPTRIVVDVQR